MPRTAEQGHTRKCLAKTMIAAIENARDAYSSDYDFRVWAQINGALEDADNYLADGTSDCICPDEA